MGAAQTAVRSAAAGELDGRAIFHPELFAGQTALVTGGGSGIGLAIARLLGGLGARVIIAARDGERLARARQQLADEGLQVSARELNIRDQASVQALFDELSRAGQHVDLLVNNAGGQFAAPALDISANGFHAVVDLNLQGTFRMCQAWAHQCRHRGRGGCIVNLVLCLEQGIPGMAHAAAARAGVVNLTRTLAWEWAPMGVRVNALAPGTIDTAGLESYDPAQLQQGLAELPIARMGSVQEVAASVAFLASPAAAFITGVCLAQDGGEHLTGASPQR